MRQANGFMILAAAALLVGCATEAPAPASAPVPVAAAVAHPQTAAAAPTEKLKVPEGYFKVTVNGQDRYCTNDLQTGSRLSRTKTCLTQAQLEAMQNGSQDFMNQIQNHMGIGAAPTGGSAGVGGH
ncbi:MAG TPA: hypothetical protein VGV09_10850 [Steroidobacteraceae bacterium]|nr:hypothetical protein [Steroidobacteraceae bacterium]